MVGGGHEPEKASYAAFMADYGTAFRTCKHGALHGTILGIGLVFPVIAINGLYAHKSWKLIFTTAGYWVVSLALMGGIICRCSENGFHFS